MRTVPSFAKQTEVWRLLLLELGFKHVIFIHSSDQEGRAMLGKFQSRAESSGIKVVLFVIEKIVQFGWGGGQFALPLCSVTQFMSYITLLKW